MAMERFCKEQGAAGRLIPVPRQISAGCGLAWSAPPEVGEALRSQLEKEGLFYESWQEAVI